MKLRQFPADSGLSVAEDLAAIRERCPKTVRGFVKNKSTWNARKFSKPSYTVTFFCRQESAKKEGVRRQP